MTATTLSEPLYLSRVAIRHESGPHRHLTVADLDLVTWPGHLAATGPNEHFLFRDAGDLLDGSPRNWAALLIIGSAETDFVLANLRAHVTDAVHARAASDSWCEFDLSRVIGAAEHDLFDAPPASLSEAHERLAAFFVPTTFGCFRFHRPWSWNLAGPNPAFDQALSCIDEAARSLTRPRLAG